MKRTGVMCVAALVAAGCASPREKDCKDLMPRVDAARAKQNPDTVAALRMFEAHDPALRDPVKTFAVAVDRQAVAAKSIEELFAALKIEKSDGPKPSVEMFEPTRSHAEHLMKRCMFVEKAPPDCALLAQALDACIHPASDDTTAEEQLLTCANGFAAVKSEDAATNESIQALATAMRDLEPYARNVGAPAKEVVRVAKQLSPKINEGTKAKGDTAKAEMEIRALCQPGTRGPS